MPSNEPWNLLISCLRLPSSLFAVWTRSCFIDRFWFCNSRHSDSSFDAVALWFVANFSAIWRDFASFSSSTFDDFSSFCVCFKCFATMRRSSNRSEYFLHRAAMRLVKIELSSIFWYLPVRAFQDNLKPPLIIPNRSALQWRYSGLICSSGFRLSFSLVYWKIRRVTTTLTCLLGDTHFMRFCLSPHVDPKTIKN